MEATAGRVDAEAVRRSHYTYQHTCIAQVFGGAYTDHGAVQRFLALLPDEYRSAG